MAFDRNKNITRYCAGHYPNAGERDAFIRELREFERTKSDHKSKENQAAEMRKTAALEMI